MPVLIIDMADQRALWRIPAWVVDRIRNVVPEWDVVVSDSPADGSGDGRGAPAESVLEAVADAEVYMGLGIPGEVLDAGPSLRWVHTGTAGVRSSLSPQMLERGVIFTNSAGVHGPAMAESVIGMILHFARCFDVAVRCQQREEWGTARFDGAGSPVREVAGSTVGLIGFGGIGEHVAWRARALGAYVIALKRQAASPPEGVEFLYGTEGLQRLLSESDYLVLAAPDTPMTRCMIDEEALARVKPGAVLINVARGRLVDEDAMLAALRAGTLRGAGLDVFANEPLPSGHPLWGMDNVLLTPHVSACTHEFWDRELELVEYNLRQYLAGLPLRNVVDKSAGY